MNRILFAVIIAYCTVSVLSCKKESFITDQNAQIYFSADTIHFDTVFTSTGSVTHFFKVFNNNDRRLMISRIKLMGSDSSFFHTNINGVPTTELSNISMEANDSLYVFVTVTINPDNAQLPFLVTDSILVEYNGNQRFVQLEAYGRNARFLRNYTVSSNEVFNNTYPYVILGELSVDEGATLSINAGTELYFHADAPLIVNGTLKANGTFSQPIVFSGDRLDEYYRDLPGSWPGIYFLNNSSNNTLTFCKIKNTYRGISVHNPSVNANNKVVVKQTIIERAYDAGIYLLNTSADISNSLVANCGTNVRIRAGGHYQFTHCTLASYSSNTLFRIYPVVSVYNYTDEDGTILSEDLDCTFTNTIIWGENGIAENEIETGKEGVDNYNLQFINCLYKAQNTPPFANFVSCIENEDPEFDQIDVAENIYQFTITSNNAPGLDNGTPTSYLKDLNDQNRNVGAPDLGAYEKQ